MGVEGAVSRKRLRLPEHYEIDLAIISSYKVEQVCVKNVHSFKAHRKSNEFISSLCISIIWFFKVKVKEQNV